jgi:hypothetical protein
MTAMIAAVLVAATVAAACGDAATGSGADDATTASDADSDGAVLDGGGDDHDDAAAPDDAGSRRDATAPIADAAAPGGAADAIAAPLASLLGDPAYLVGGTAGATDVTTVVTGGARPYACTLYSGPGQGTVPAGVTQDLAADPAGCVLAGGVAAGAGDVPGAYGFIVTVEDAAGDSIEIPVAYQGPPCDTAAATLVPGGWPPPVEPAGAPRSWQLAIADLDAIESGAVCDACMSVSLFTRGPLTIAPGLDCASGGDLCSDCDGCVALAAGCPGAATASRPIELRAHAPLRADGRPAWATVAIGVAYSGGSLDPCGGKNWGCHLETLQLPPTAP